MQFLSTGTTDRLDLGMESDERTLIAFHIFFIANLVEMEPNKHICLCHYPQKYVTSCGN